MAKGPYSFANWTCHLTGPNGSTVLGYGAGVAEEGMTIDYVDEDSSSVTGADGELMHSINASKTATITVRLLKTSPVNAILMAMRNADKSTPSTAGQNTIIGQHMTSGDQISVTQVAFKKVPPYVAAKAGGINEWTFTGKADEVLGTY